MNGLLRDARFGLRLLWRSPGFSAIAVIALALGIAANTAIFSVVHATLLAPLPYPNPDQLVMVWSKTQDGKNSTSVGDYLDWKRQNAVFQDLNAFGGQRATLSLSDKPEQVQAARVTPGFYTMVGDPMFLGRDFMAEEGEVGRDRVVILTHRMWVDRFSSDPNILGRLIRIDGTQHAVVGVLRPGLADRSQSPLTLPFAFPSDQINHDFHSLLVMGRLKPGVTLRQAGANMETVTAQLADAYPASNTGWGASVELLQNDFLNPNTVSALWLLLGAVAFVLLIACANVANLLLAQGTVRQREVAVRASLGASRAQLFRQFLAENLVLASIGGVVGVALSWALLKAIVAAMPPDTLPIEADIRLSVPVLLFTLAVSVLSGLLFGCVPAWQATRIDLNAVLKDEGRSAMGGARHALRRALVVGEFALALTLLAGGGLAIHSLVKLMNVDLGFRTDHLLTFALPVPQGRLESPERINAFYGRLLAGVGGLPGVVTASVSTGMPIQGMAFGMGFQVVAKPVDPSIRPSAGFNMVSTEYFRTLGIQMTRGRSFTEQDRHGSLPVAIVNEVFVKRYLAGLDPLTQRLAVEQLVPGVAKLGPAIEWQIVGVYRTVHNGGVRGGDDAGFPEIDVPFNQSPWPMTAMAVRTSGDPSALAKSIAGVVHDMDADLPMADVKTMGQIVNEALAGDRFQAWLFGGFAALALFLAAVGIYGVMSFAVAQRTHEIGLRMALGAESGRVVRDVLKEGLVTAVLGLALGTVGAYFVGRAMQGMWYGVGVIEPTSFSAVAATLLISALVACIIPARRAALVDPLTALRQR
jgi:putative ABC transport system permease protein